MRIHEKIGRALGCIHRGWRARMSHRLEPLGLGSGAAIFFVAIMRHEGASQEEISSFLTMDKATTARAVRKLVDLGYVTRERDSRDARQWHLFLSAKGKKILPAIKKERSQMAEHLFHGLSGEEKKVLHALLQRVAKNLENEGIA